MNAKRSSAILGGQRVLPVGLAIGFEEFCLPPNHLRVWQPEVQRGSSRMPLAKSVVVGQQHLRLPICRTADPTHRRLHNRQFNTKHSRNPIIERQPTPQPRIDDAQI